MKISDFHKKEVDISMKKRYNIITKVFLLRCRQQLNGGKLMRKILKSLSLAIVMAIVSVFSLNNVAYAAELDWNTPVSARDIVKLKKAILNGEEGVSVVDLIQVKRYLLGKYRFTIDISELKPSTENDEKLMAIFATELIAEEDGILVFRNNLGNYMELIVGDVTSWKDGDIVSFNSIYGDEFSYLLIKSDTGYSVEKCVG